MRYRTRGRLTCPMVLRVPWGGGIRAPEHHSEANESIFTNVPGLRVVMPSSPQRAYGLLLAAIRDPDPVIFFEPKRIYRQYKEVVPDDGEALPLDVCYVLRDGSDVTLVTWGAQVKETLEAAEKLAGEGISAEVIDVATLKPLDFATIAESVRKTGRCVIVHEAPKTAGFGAEIAARLAEESMYDLRRAGRARHRLRHPHPAVPPGDEVPAQRGADRRRGAGARWPRAEADAPRPRRRRAPRPGSPADPGRAPATAVTLGERDSDWPQFVWTDARAAACGGWVPAVLFDRDSRRWPPRCADYDTRELDADDRRDSDPAPRARAVVVGRERARRQRLDSGARAGTARTARPTTTRSTPSDADASYIRTTRCHEQHKTFLLPDLGEGLPDATIVEWFVKVGDTIRLDEPWCRWKPPRPWSRCPRRCRARCSSSPAAPGDVVVTGAMLAEFELDPSLPQRAEGQDTGHHHGGGQRRPSGAGDKVVASDDGGTIASRHAPQPAPRRARRRRHRGRRDAELRCGAQRTGSRGRRRQGDAGGARAGAQARRRPLARARHRRRRRGDDGRRQARRRRWHAPRSARRRPRAPRRAPAAARGASRLHPPRAARCRKPASRCARSRRASPPAASPNSSRACAATWRG